MEREKIKKLILEKNFESARELILKIESKELSKLIGGLSNETGHKNFYKFIDYLIKTEKSKKRLIGYHLIASVILSIDIPHLFYSFRKAIYHVKEAIKLEPKDLSLKEHLLFVYESPDAKDFLSKKEVKKIANEILDKNQDSYIAKTTLKDLEKYEK